MSSTDFKDYLSWAGDFKRKSYVPRWVIKSNCPNVRISEEEEWGMMSYEIESDKIDKFLNTYEFEVIYLPKNSATLGEVDMPNDLGYKLSVSSLTTYIIKCRIKGLKNV
jgi:hypothetical protein